MKKLRMLIELEYDDEIMHHSDPDAINWFHQNVLLSPSEGGELILNSNELGDSLGIVKVLGIVDNCEKGAAMPDRVMSDKPCRWLRTYRDGVQECNHQLFDHLELEISADPRCHGCPCHEPAQDHFREVTQKVEPAQGADTEECCVWTLSEDSFKYSTGCSMWRAAQFGLSNTCHCGKPVKIAPQQRGEEQGGSAMKD